MNHAPSKKLFGTDGIRCVANQANMTPERVVKIGQALGFILKRDYRGWKPSVLKKVVVGKDTRLSGYMVETALSSGLNSMGMHVQLLGPLPTPGIAYLTRNLRAASGVVISASHNAYPYNGIKVFNHLGDKISDALEEEIEHLVLHEDLTKELAQGDMIGRTRRIDDSQGRYIVFVKNTFPLSMILDGVKVVLDTAHGASYQVAPAIFEELGAEVIHMGHQPNGLNINHGVGALFPEKLAEKVVESKADIGISLDGDGDRVILCDEKGKILSGDHILTLCAIAMKEEGKLHNNTIVATEMSSYGLKKTLAREGITVLTTKVGDRHVLEKMKQHNCLLGGEKSGHIIFSEYSSTGDGCIAALKVLSIMRQKGFPLSELGVLLEEVPQVLLNCKVACKRNLEELSSYQKVLKKIQHSLQDRGRVLVRFSGTEDKLLRILVEGNDQEEIQSYAQQLSHILKSELAGL